MGQSQHKEKRRDLEDDNRRLRKVLSDLVEAIEAPGASGNDYWERLDHALFYARKALDGP